MNKIINILKSKSLLIIIILFLGVANYWQSCNYKNLKKQLNAKEIQKIQDVIKFNKNSVIVITASQDSTVYYYEELNEKIDKVDNPDSLLHLWRKRLSEQSDAE